MADAPADCPSPRTSTPGQLARGSDWPMTAGVDFSLIAPVTAASLDGSVLVETMQAALREAEVTKRWTVSAGGPWYAATPSGHQRRTQGWKLHVSATVSSAEQVLHRSLPVLLAGRSAFRFAATLDHVAMLNTRHTSRGHPGTFLTVYPDSDREAVRLAEELHRATAGLDGPRILSDRPYRPNSLVHYRYGGFPDEHAGLTTPRGDGMTGALAFLLRRRHRSPRACTADEVPERGEPV